MWEMEKLRERKAGKRARDDDDDVKITHSLDWCIFITLWMLSRTVKAALHTLLFSSFFLASYRKFYVRNMIPRKGCHLQRQNAPIVQAS